MNAIFLHAINFFVLAAILFFVLRKKLAVTYQQQARDFENRLRVASQQYEATKAAFDALKKKSEGLEGELASMRQSSIREIENESARLEQEAERQIQMAVTDGESRLQVEAERIRSGLEHQLLTESIRKSQEILGRDMKTLDSDWISKMLSRADAGAAGEGKKTYAS